MNVQIGLASCVFRSIEILTVTRRAGFDFLLADMEHGAMSLGEVATLCVAGRAAGYPVYVRVPKPSSDYLTRAADCGALGIIVPHVDSLAEAQHIVDKLRFPPHGNRSLPSPLVVTQFEPVSALPLIEACDKDFRVYAMIECAQALDEVEAMAALAGLDGLIVGSQDLAQSLGHTGQLTHPDVLAAFARIAAATRRNGKVFGVMGLPPAILSAHILPLGPGLIVATNEINLLSEAAIACADATRQLVDAHTPS